MKRHLRLALVAIALFIGACADEGTVNTDSVIGPSAPSLHKPSPPPGNANPVFAFRDFYQITPNRSVHAIYVMDVTGSNKTKVYSNYTSQTAQSPDCPAWSADGTKLCFTLNRTDLYTLSISLVNGYPVGSNPVKIGDGVAGGGNYERGAWRPGASQIACVWRRTSNPDKIHLLPSTGGSTTVLYSASSTDWVIEDDISFKSDGSRLAFVEHQSSTGLNILKVLDVVTGYVVQAIDLSQFASIVELDWAKSAGSNVVAIETTPNCDNSNVGSMGKHQIFSLDVSSSSPALTLLITDRGGLSWSPNDTQIAIACGIQRGPSLSGCSISRYNGIGIFTLATQTLTFPGNYGNVGYHYDWKR